MSETRELTFETAKGEERWGLPPYTGDQVRSLPVVMDLVDAARAWDLSRSQAYELARTGALPFRTIRLGKPPTGRGRGPVHYKVRLVDLIESLGMDADQPAASAVVPAASGG